MQSLSRAFLASFSTLFIFGGLYLSGPLQAQEKALPVPKTAVRAPALHESLLDKWKEQQDETVKLDISGPQNRIYQVVVSGTRQDDRFAGHVERALQTVLFRAVKYKDLPLEGISVEKDGSVTYNGSRYSVWFRINGSNLNGELLAGMRTQLYEQFSALVNSPHLEAFDTYLTKKVYFGILLDRELITTKADEEELLDMVKAVMEGHTVKEFEVSETGDLIFNKKVMSLRFFYPEQGRSTYFTLPEHDELTQKFKRHIRYVYDKREKEVEKTPEKVIEFQGPALVERIEQRPELKQGIPISQLVRELPHFRRLLSHFQKTHPDLYARLSRETDPKSDLRVEMLPVNSLKAVEDGFHFAHVIQYNGRRIVIAENKWNSLDKGRVADQGENPMENRSYCLLYALLERILPQTDTKRTSKAHELTMELAFLVEDKGRVEAIDRDTMRKLVDSFVISDRTERLRAYVTDMAQLLGRDKEYLSGLGASGKEMTEVLQLAQELAESQASESLNLDFKEVLGRQTATDSPAGSVDLALWRLFQTMQKDPHWAKEIYQRQSVLREATALILRGEIDSTEDLKEALELLKESRKPKPKVVEEEPLPLPPVPEVKE
ncbi:MAG: hypothetical protein KDD51_13070 [Bdellovibrionales bacterium]|nr:hypothetical protein [Bdellovibrionales bacterium]